MPGDTITQKITVKNDANNKVKVKIYMRSLGAHEDSKEFLSKLGLKVQKSAENQMAYMFDAAASETAQLTDWVYLGLLYSGGEVNLDVTLDVPIELDDTFQNKIGYLDWEFRIEEFPIGPDDPQPPQTGDTAPVGLWIGGLVVSASIIVILLLAKRKEEKAA
jgi:LPXTG-motif cell wall-anchored protein